MKREIQPTLLVIGGSGFLGYSIAEHFKRKYRVVSTFISSPVPQEGVLQIPLDLKDREWLKTLIWRIRPTAIIYVAGYQDFGYMEGNPSVAERIISKGPGEVIKVADILQPHFIYISSCYVFDGERGNYNEVDSLSPVNTLGKLKLSGENVVKAKASHFTVIRTAPLFGISHAWRPTFFDNLRVSLGMGRSVTLQNDEIHNFAPIGMMISLIEKVLASSSRKNIFHLGGLTKMTHFEFGQLFARLFGFDSGLIRTQPLQQGRSVLDYSLNFTQTIKSVGLDSHDIEENLQEQFKTLR